MSKEAKQAGRKPDAVCRAGKVAVAIWTKLETDGDRQYKSHRIVVRKAWKDKGSEEWQQQSITLFPEEMPVLAALLNRMFVEHTAKHEYPSAAAGGQ